MAEERVGEEGGGRQKGQQREGGGGEKGAVSGGSGCGKEGGDE